MSTFPGTPHILKGGIVVVDPASANVARIVTFSINPDKLSRTFQIQSTGGEQADRSEAMRFKGPAVESIKLEAEIDATDQLEFPDQHGVAINHGIQPQLAVLESLANPTSAQLLRVESEASSGTLEIAPMEAPLTLFVWGRDRVVPVRLTEFSVTEEAFDVALNPIRATVGLGLRVLSVDDLGFGHKGGNLFMAYLQSRERLATRSQPGSFTTLGIEGIN